MTLTRLRAIIAALPRTRRNLRRMANVRRLFFSLRPQPKATGHCRSCNGIQLSVSGSIVPPNYHRCLAFIVASHKCATGFPHNSGSKGIVMGTVMIRCPQTRRTISTGIKTDVATFHATPVFFSQVLCPLCGLTHEWFAKDAWICDLVVCNPHSDHCACENELLP